MADNLDKQKKEALLDIAKAKREILRLQEEQNRSDRDMSLLIKEQNDLIVSQVKEVKKLNQERY